jgi:hypothetical protein
MRKQVALIAPVLGLLAGCSSSIAGTASPSSPGWPETVEVNNVGVGEISAFPPSLRGWTLRDAWSTLPRAFTNQLTEVSGPNYESFPATMNGCDQQRFLVRWRVVSEGIDVHALAVDTVGGVVAVADGRSGWMDLDGCHIPAFEFAGSSLGSNLTDVTVEVQHYWVSP